MSDSKIFLDSAIGTWGTPVDAETFEDLKCQKPEDGMYHAGWVKEPKWGGFMFCWNPELKEWIQLILPSMDGWFKHKLSWITCTTCPEQMTCAFAFDQYNTNGDCLAEK